jgi:rhodanese-related sulfurtransferase
MCGRPSTTIGFERCFNPVLQLSARDFLHSAGEVSARPLNMTAILATNRGEADYNWAMPHDHHSVDDLSVADAPGWLEKTRAVVVDVREPVEYQAGHVPDALSIPQAELALHLDELRRDRDVLVVSEGGTRSARAAASSNRPALAKSRFGGTSAWRRAGLPTQADHPA